MHANLKPLLICLTLLSSGLACGCDAEKIEPSQSTANSSDANTSQEAWPESGMSAKGKWKSMPAEEIKFKDSIASNVDAPDAIQDLVFTNKDGGKIKMKDYLGQKHVLLVFTQGFSGKLCPFCTTQTSRLVANYQKFQDRDCEVIVVYPGPKDHLQKFVEAALETEKEQVDDVPFPIVLDTGFQATDFFDIHSMHAHPSTYLIDKQGNAKFAYVGIDSTADRPSVKALLDRLDNLQ